MARFFALILACSSLSYLYATPLELSERISKATADSISVLSNTEISAFKPFTLFASVAYCPPEKTIDWSCGGKPDPCQKIQRKLDIRFRKAKCDTNSGFLPTASGGDGTDTQFWYVGFDPTLTTIIVAHQGTNPSSIIADLTDVDIQFVTLDSKLFPGIDPSVKVHDGFAASHARAAPSVLSAVQQTLTAHPTASVSIVGHSLGAALALLDSVFLPLHLPSGTAFKTVTYGMPRVGNQAFANYVDVHVTSIAGGKGLTHINNKKDPVPILPERSLGFHHPSGEVHIQRSDAWDACPGQDNASDLCIAGDVPTILESDELDHTGPYDGIEMGC
ncbi:lipase [Phellopilus nigrolimitatus]|nr:lipase [Phellopilus nigrolimitatus]